MSDPMTSPASGSRGDLPPKFQCRICLKIKNTNNANFSKKELNTYTRRTNNGQRLNMFTAKLRCRHCACDPAHELECQNCYKVLSKDDFSYSARTRPSVAWCKRCSNWQELVEPGTETLPRPGPDDMLREDPDEEDVDEGGEEFQDEMGIGNWPTIATENNTMTAPAMTDDTNSTRQVPGSVDLILPNRDMHGRLGSISSASASNTRSSPSISLSLVDPFSKLDPFESRKTNTTGCGSSTTEKAADSDDSRLQMGTGTKKKTTYTAYDPAGKAHIRTTASSTTYANSISGTNTTETYSKPTIIPGNVISSKPYSNGFAKIKSARVPRMPFAPLTTLTSYAGLSRSQPQRQYGDDDESGDEV